MSKNTAVLSIYALWKAGELDRDIELKIIKPAIVEYCKIYDVYAGFRAQGLNYTRGIEATAEKMILTESKVKWAIAAVV